MKAAHRNWEVLVPFFRKDHRATPSNTTEYSPFFLLHGREMRINSNEYIKTKVPVTDRNIREQMDKLKASLKQAYKAATIANRKAHHTKKRY